MLNTARVAIVALLLSWVPVHAQQHLGTITPPDIGSPEEPVAPRFDTNEVPFYNLTISQVAELNFSPNIIFNADSGLGFVAYPATNRIMVFDPVEAEVVHMLEVGDNPGWLAQSPDGKYLLAVCLRIRENLPNQEDLGGSKVGTIAKIDTETLEVQLLELEGVFFSVANNMVISNDGKWAFVASSGTDQILRLDAENLTESGTRLEVEGGSRPSAVTLAPDGSFLAAVLVGSDALPESETPDSIQIVDTEPFSLGTRLTPPKAEVVNAAGITIAVPHNFLAANNAAISADGRWLVIGDRELSLNSSLPEFTKDHALLFDLETGELAEQFGVGGVSFTAATTPDGSQFVVISATDVAIINPEDLVATTGGQLRSQYREGSRPVFSADGMDLYVSSPVLDEIHVYDVETIAFKGKVSVGESFVSPALGVSAAPMDLAVRPDGTFATVVYNANTVELFRDTFRFAIPQMLTQNIDTVEIGDETEEIPASERFFSGIALNNFGSQATGVEMTAVGFVDQPVVGDFLNLIWADPNPTQVCADAKFGQTTIRWDVGTIVEAVEVRVSSPNGDLLVEGEASGSIETGEWVTNEMVFFLIDPATRDVLDSVTVYFTEIGCPPPVFVAFPNPAQACGEGALGQTTLGWDTTDLTDEAEVRIGSPEGSIFTQGGPKGQAQTGKWVTEGMVFYLMDQPTGEVLKTLTLTLSDAGCPFLIEDTLQPDESITLTGDDFLGTNKALEHPVDFEGWVRLNSDENEIAGMFLSYDGALNRLDGGLMTSDPPQLSVFPEVRIRDGFFTQIEVVNPNYALTSVTFDLFDLEGQLIATASRSISAQTRRAYPVLGDPNDPGSNGLFDTVTGYILIAATPNPIQVCDEGELGETTIIFNARGLSEEVEVRAGSVDGEILYTGEPEGSVETGASVTDGMVFYLLDVATGEILDTVTVLHTELNCPPPVITSTPNPVQVCDESGVGKTTLVWDATDVAEEVEVRVGSADGEIVGTGGAKGFVTTGVWVTDGMVFVLMDAATGEVLDTVAVRLANWGCPLLDFEDGYVRMFARNLVGSESYYDDNRLAVVAGQPLTGEAIHFAIPQFVAFGGTDTILKFINPSSIPVGGKIEEEEEEPEPAPLLVTVSLRADDGTTTGGPVTVELAHGESLRTSVIDLFNLQDNGTIQSGWIDITTDGPGLLGSAEIQAFRGAALSTIPFQPVGSSKVVFPHVAQALGYSSGLAVLNIGDQPAQVTVELRRSDSQLVGVLQKTLQPGHRLIGTIDTLFPGSGEFLGGSIKVLSDQPVNSLELFYTDNLKVLSVVPAHEIE